MLILAIANLYGSKHVEFLQILVIFWLYSNYGIKGISKIYDFKTTCYITNNSTILKFVTMPTCHDRFLQLNLGIVLE